MNPEPNEVDTTSETARAFVDRLFVLMRTIVMHGPDHPITAQTATQFVHTIEASQPPFAVQFIGHGVFRDRTLVPMDPETFLRVQQLARALHNLSIHELSVDEVPDIDTVIGLGAAIARGAQGHSGAMDHLQLQGLRWREIPDAQWGVEGEKVSPETFALVQVTLAIGEAEQLMTHPQQPWNWSGGVSTLRRIERALEVSSSAAARAVETCPGAWTVARRALAGTLHGAHVLRELGVTPVVRRAVNHALLALALNGLRPRGGLVLPEAVGPTLARMLEAPVLTRGGIDPHRFKVSTLLDLFERHPEDRSAWLPPMHLIAILYELERARCPEGLPFDLTRPDLLAHATAEAGRAFDETWTRAVVRAAGVVPPGAIVQLADGRAGIAMEPGPSGDPLRPRVLVDGVPVEPRTRVRLVSGAETATAR